jgi:outer membrane protein assembly factor BamB
MKPRKINMFASFAVRTIKLALTFSLLPMAVSLAQEPTRAPQEAQISPQESDWTQWRGPDRDCIVKHANWPESLDEKVLTKKWSVPLGESYSGPIVVGDKVFTTETVDRKSEIVRALDRNTGKEIWKAEWPGAMTVPFFAAKNGSWIRATPAYDSGKLFVGSMVGVLVCLNAEDGKVLWRVDFGEKFGTGEPAFGLVCSPLIDGDFVYIQAGGGFCKLRKETGEIVWRGAVDGDGMMDSPFASPSIATIADKRQGVIQTRSNLMGVDLETGSQLWSQPIKSFRGMNILTPSVYKGGVFVSTYGGTTQFLTVTNSGSTFGVGQKWEVGKQGYMSSPVIIDGHAYLTMKNRTIACFDLENGKQTWSSPRFSDYASLVSDGEKILALDSSGLLILFRANPEKFEQLGSRKISDDSWAHLAVRGNQVFVRELKAMTVFDWQRPE